MFSIDYFREELLRFREVMQDREIMYDVDRRDRAVKGLSHVYLNTESLDECSQNLYWASMQEFFMRSMYVDLSLIRP